MSDVFKDVSQDEIEALSIKQLGVSNFKKDESLKIERIDKEYKRHNKQAIRKAIIRGTITLLCAGVVLKNDSNLPSFDFENLMNTVQNMTESFSYLPVTDVLAASYVKMFDGVNYIIDKIGFMGIVLAISALKFVLATVKDTKKTLKLREELEYLKQSIGEKEFTKNHNR